MSFQAMTWAVEQKLPTNQKMVLLMLANRTNNDTGRCDPSQKRLADDCGMGISTLKRALIGLEQAGFIEVIQRKNGDVNLPNQYILKMNGVGPEWTNPPSKLTQGLGQSGLRVGPERSKGVGPNRATNQEYNNQEINHEYNHLLESHFRQEQPSHVQIIEKNRKQELATPLNENYKPSVQNEKLAAELGVDISTEWQIFCDHHQAKGSKFVDWSSAFNTWVRYSAELKKKYQNQSKPKYFSNEKKDYSAGVKPDGSF